MEHYTEFLPISRADMEARGWDQLDFVVVGGDAYVDHPSFGTAIIDLYADWCGPCRQTAPIMKELAKEYAGKIVIYKVNVDKQKELAALFNATSIPLFVFIPMKGDPQLFRGAADKATYKKAIDEFLLK